MPLSLAVPFNVSFEFFPPKTPEMEESLWRAVKRLEPLAPKFVSVTYGAGGSTRERTHKTVQRILNETALVPAAHLTCADASRHEVNEVAHSYWEMGVRHIVALRAQHDFEISVATFPEGHPDSRSLDAELDNLKRKIDAGATRAITQFFFDNWTYLRYVDHARKAGISVPIVPGIMPVTNFTQMTRFAAQAGATVPRSMAPLFAGLESDPETRKLVAAVVAAEQCRQLADAGVTEFHFYTLNRADLAYALCHILGLRPGDNAGSRKPEAGRTATEDGSPKTDGQGPTTNQP